MLPDKNQIPSKFAILPYYFAGAISFVTAVWLVFISAPDFAGHFFQPSLLAITHLTILGWATMVIFGASNQLAPVIAEQHLYSEKIPLLVLALKLGGIVMLVSSFWTFSFNWLTYAGGMLILFSFLLHAYNIFLTMRQSVHNIINDFILTAHVWLVLTAIIGLMLLINLRWPFLPEDHLHYLRLHGSVGMAGWFIQLIIGVSARLIPMFLLSTAENKKELNLTFYLLNLALILFLIEGMVLKSLKGLPYYLLMVIIALIPYVRYVRKCYRTAMRKQTDQGMKQTLLALVLLSLPLVSLALSFILKPQKALLATTGFGFAFFFGFVSILIMAQTFKTLPFIVWMHINDANRLPELLPKDLFSEQKVKWQLYVYLPGFLIFLSGIMSQHLLLLYSGSGIMLAGALWYLTHVCSVLMKLKKK